MKKHILSLGNALTKLESQRIKGGDPELEPSCIGTGTGGVIQKGYSPACDGQPTGTDCLINGYLATCCHNPDENGNFWFY